jgi:hypothetical protein
MLPYRKWKPPKVDVPGRLQRTAQVSVCGFQTRLYFYMLEQRIGKLEAEIAIGGFFGVLTSSAPRARTTTWAA